MARGAVAKQEIFKKLEEVFPNAFWATEKEFRIPWAEDGSEVQLKLTLTAAKDNVDHEMKVGTTTRDAVTSVVMAAEPNQEEIDTLKTLMEKLGM
jgi:hypothetical protein